MLAMLQIGLCVDSPTEWTAPDGSVWSMRLSQDSDLWDFRPIIDAIQASIVERQWAEAAITSFAGSGLEGGGHDRCS